MKPTNDGGPAFPFPTMEQGSTCTAGAWAASPGMTLRDYFAAKALTGMSRLIEQGVQPEQAARDAFAYADAMLKAREGGAS